LFCAKLGVKYKSRNVFVPLNPYRILAEAVLSVVSAV
jgi:hypothetical protein